MQVWLLNGGSRGVEPNASIGGSVLHGADVRAIAWHGAESGLIATADTAGTLRAWENQYGGAPRLFVVSAAGHAPTDVAFAGNRLVSAGKDGTLRVWTLSDLRPFIAADKPNAPCAHCKSPEDWVAEMRRRIGRDSAPTRSAASRPAGRAGRCRVRRLVPQHPSRRDSPAEAQAAGIE